MTSQAVTGAAASSSYSGFGSRQEEKLYDTINFNLLSLLGMRFAKFFREVQEGNYNPYSKAQAAEDAHLKEIIRKFLKKLVKMERKKYTAPRLSEALKDLASLLNVTSSFIEKDAFSLQGSNTNTSDDEEDDVNSLFSKFTATRRPSLFYGDKLVQEASRNSTLNATRKSKLVDKND